MSLINTYQSRKTLLAQKLGNKGVEASATDGLTTLINKVDDIEVGFTEGLFLYGENNIVQDGDDLKLYALLIQNGKPMANKDVRLVDTYDMSTTDNAGVAGFEYTGEGSGLKQLYAQYGSIVSETYSIIDGIFFDKGTQTESKEWTGLYNCTINRGDEYSTITLTNPSDMGRLLLNPNVYEDICFEFEFRRTNNVTGNCVSLRNSGGSSVGLVTFANLNLDINTWYTLKFELKNSKIYYYVNGTAIGNVNVTGTWSRFWLHNLVGDTVNFKNFVVYPI